MLLFKYFAMAWTMAYSSMTNWLSGSRVLRISVLAVGIGLYMSAISVAQTNPGQDAAPPTPQDLPPSESITLETKDRVVLRCEWFPGIHKKSTVPVILLHDWGGSRREMLALAERLQHDLGCAVIVPDWRGHGESVNIATGGPRIDRDRFGRNDLLTMAEDIETCKRFLRDKHNAGELNIDMLCVVAVHQMATTAMSWTITDWSWPMLGGKRQGQDVKLLVLISPVRRFKTLVMNDLLRTPPIGAGAAQGVTTLVIHGNNDPTTDREARAIIEALTRGRPTDIPADKRFELREVFQETFASQEVGSDLIANANSNVIVVIMDIIKGKLIDRSDKFPWQERSP